MYHRTRGAHTYFAKLGEVPRYGGYVVNLIHYQDAAGLAVAVRVCRRGACDARGA